MNVEIKAIREKVLNKIPIDEIKKSHPELSSKKHFFEMIIKPDADEEILDTLGVLLQGIKDGIFTEEYASVKFGEILVEKFVKNKVAR